MMLYSTCRSSARSVAYGLLGPSHNTMLKKEQTGMAPTELFTWMRFPNSYNHLQLTHVWGCPVYVLDPMLQEISKMAS
jgi:hypothetical protein